VVRPTHIVLLEGGELALAARAAESSAGVKTQAGKGVVHGQPVEQHQHAEPAKHHDYPGEGEAVLAPGHPGQAAHDVDLWSSSSRAEGCRGHTVTALEVSL
jgi:hypothetical protein